MTTTASLLVSNISDVEIRAFITDRVISADDLDDHGRIDAAGDWVEFDSAAWTDEDTAEFESDDQALTSVATWVLSEGWAITGPLAFDSPVPVTR